MRTVRRLVTRRARAVQLVTLLVLGVAGMGCPGGGDATGVASVPAALVLSVPSAAPGAAIVGVVRGVVMPAGAIAGRIGTTAVSAGRVNDSTIAVPLPLATVPGAYQLVLTVGSRELSAPLQVTASARPANPDALVDSVLGALDASLATGLTSFVGAAATLPGLDTAAFRRSGAVLDTELRAIRAAYAALSPADRAEMATFLAANLPIVQRAMRDAAASMNPAAVRMASTSAASTPTPTATTAPGATTFASLATATTIASDVCTAGAACGDALAGYLRRFSGAVVLVGGVVVAMDLLSTTGGPGAKLANRALAALSVGALLYFNAQAIVERFVLPSIAELTAEFETSTLVAPAIAASRAAPVAPLRSSSAVAPSAAVAQPDLTGLYTSGRPAAVPVMADYRSITAGDLASPAAAKLAAAYAEMQRVWRQAAATVPFVEIAPPALPASPARTVRRPVPPAQLVMGAIAPAAVTATTSASGDLWLATFTDARAGAEHDVAFTVRFRPPGLPEQTMPYRLVLRPAEYVVASVALTPGVQDSVLLNGTFQLTAVARDSSAVVITGKPVAWTTSNASVAAVDNQGRVTGASLGTATVAATVGGVRMERVLRVVGNPFAGYTLEFLVYDLDYSRMTPYQLVQPGQAVTVANGVTIWSRLMFEGRAVGRIQNISFGVYATYPARDADHRVPAFTVATVDTVTGRTLQFPMDATLSNAAYRSIVGRTISMRQATGGATTVLTFLDGGTGRRADGTYGGTWRMLNATSSWYVVSCTPPTGATLLFKKEAMGVVEFSATPTGSLLMLYKDGTLGFNGGVSCPNLADRWIVE